MKKKSSSLSPTSQAINDLLGGKYPDGTNVPDILQEPVVEDDNISEIGAPPTEEIKIFVDPDLRHHFTSEELQSLKERRG